MTELVTYSLHQRDASLDVRERLSLRLEAFSDGGALVLATCHRVEIIAALPRTVDAHGWLAARIPASGVNDGELVGQLRVRRGHQAVRHLMAVALGLDSQLAGERQILGQLRRAYDSARAGRHLDPLVATAVQSALRLGRESRASSPLGPARSVGSLAVDDVVAALRDPAHATVLVIGAGEVGSLAIRAFAHRVGRLVVANRDLAKAREIAERHEGQAIPLAELPRALELADAVISAADTRGTLLTAQVLGRRLGRGPLIVVDIAVPRSVAADARALAGLRYRTVDDLADASPIDAATLAAARRSLTQASSKFLRESRARDAAPAIAQLRESGEELRRRKVAEALRKLGHLSDRDRRVVDALSRSLVGALLHGPTVAARSAPAKAAALRDAFAQGR